MIIGIFNHKKKHEEEETFTGEMCKVCRKPIYKNGGYKCEECKDGYYHKDCLDDDYLCPKCAKKSEEDNEEKEDDDDEYEDYSVIIESMGGNTQTLEDELSKSEAERKVKELVNEIDTKMKGTTSKFIEIDGVYYHIDGIASVYCSNEDE